MPDSRMGHFRVAVEISNRLGGPSRRVEALVDTGATYTWIPSDMLEPLGIEPEEDWPFVLADGREVTYPVAWIHITLRGRTQPTIVVFGKPESDPILGVVTLEEYRLAADPVNQRLVSVPGLLKGVTTRPSPTPRKSRTSSPARPTRRLPCHPERCAGLRVPG